MLLPRPEIKMTIVLMARICTVPRACGISSVNDERDTKCLKEQCIYRAKW